MKKSRIIAILCYLCAVIAYVLAVMKIFWDDKSWMGFVWLCVGSLWLCAGSVLINK